MPQFRFLFERRENKHKKFFVYLFFKKILKNYIIIKKETKNPQWFEALYKIKYLISPIQACSIKY